MLLSSPPYSLNSVVEHIAQPHCILNDLLNLELIRIIPQFGALSLSDLMMDNDILNFSYIARGVQLRTHSVLHKTLSRLSANKARVDNSGSKHLLESISAMKYCSLKYPSGVYQIGFSDANIDNVNQAGCRDAVVASIENIHPSGNFYQSSQVCPRRKGVTGFLLGLVVNCWRGLVQCH